MIRKSTIGALAVFIVLALAACNANQSDRSLNSKKNNGTIDVRYNEGTNLGYLDRFFNNTQMNKSFQPSEQQNQTQAPPQQQQQAQAPKGISQYAQRVIDLTNKERTKAGLPALKADSLLSNVAQKKSEDMQQNNYFSHTSPTYGTPFDMMNDFGVTFNTAGENIAKGQPTPEEVVAAWMNSPGHRENILKSDFTHIGVGFEERGNNWSQMFIGKKD